MEETSITAATFAKNAPHAGYLCKLGGSIAEYKRRFFVLKPTTCLYYFLSPNDLEPRGCIDLDEYLNDDDDEEEEEEDYEDDEDYNDDDDEKNREGKLQINSLGCLPDGRFRFEIVLPTKKKDGSSTTKTTSPQMKKSSQHCTNACDDDNNRDDDDDSDGNNLINNEQDEKGEGEGNEKKQNHQTHHQQQQQHEEKTRVILEARNEQVGLEWMEAIKTQRLSYSKNERKKLLKKMKKLQNDKKNLQDQIDELRLVEEDRDGAIQDAKEWKEKMGQLNDALCVLKRWMSKAPDDGNDDGNTEDGSKDSLTTSYSDNSCEGNNTSLSITEDDLLLEEINLPETNFASLSNVCRGVRENLRLTSAEANATLEDLKKSNDEVKALSSRMVKAEKYLCKLWEENCSMRDELKKKKVEKKVLVKEVKALLQKSKQDHDEILSLKKVNEELKQINTVTSSKDDKISRDDELLVSMPSFESRRKDAPKRLLGTVEKNLLRALEDDIDSTLLQHQKLLDSSNNVVVTNGESGKNQSTEACNEKDAHFINEEFELEKKGISEDSTPTVSNASQRKTIYKDHLPHKMFEPRDGNGSESDDSVFNNDPTRRTFSPLRPKSLLDQITLQEKQEEEESLINLNDITTDESQISDTETQLNTLSFGNPLDKLDDDSITLPSEQSLKSLVTENGEATSRLSCPLLDVKQRHNVPDTKSIYHLTFYSSKIGLQFQKAPNNIAPSGLLTDAMTADYDVQDGQNATASSRSDAELRLIASLSNKTASKKNALKDSTCPVILPKDIVLVCGFHGFDETANNQRPSLGARLIAFDGISIERGPWTFDTVRKAIKARERPLTLSFRDDFLTMDQRAILTKAAAEITNVYPPPPPLASQDHSQQKQGVPRIINAMQKKTYNQFNSEHILGYEETPSQSLAQDEKHCLKMEHFHNDNNIDASVSTENISRSSDKWQSFSDAGSSSVFSTTFAPLMANLIAGIREDHEENSTFTPEYFRRDPKSLEKIQTHREFKAGLL